MSWDKNICKICDSPNSPHTLLVNYTDLYGVRCPKCNYYRISDSSLESKVTISKEDMLLFSGYLRLNSSEDKPITITTDYFNKISEIVSPFKRMLVPEKVDNLLLYIYGSTTKVLGEVYISDDEIHRFYLLTLGDLITILEYLKERKFIRYSHDDSKRCSRCILTIEGWERYEQIKSKTLNINSKQAFVAMSFDEGLKNIFENGIAPAAKECGFEAIRVDTQEYNEKICERIIAEINKSKFVIADFTQNKHGVYFEAGYALGLGIPVIWLCKKEQIDKGDLHFDTRQYNYINWADIEDLKERLVSRIQITINKPKHSKNP